MQTPHSTTKPDGLFSAPAAKPATSGLGSRTDRPEGQPETGSLFEDELRRAAGDDGTADAKRTQREASDARRSAQAGKAEHNQAQREERRTERAGAQEARAERRSEQSSAAEARAESEVLRGQGDAEAAAIYASAYGKDVEFYSFVRSLEAYRKTLGENTTLVVPPDHEFFKFLDPSRASGTP